MKILIISLFLTLSFTTAAIAQNKSIYTSTKTSACRTIKSSSEGTGSYIGECRGVGGYKARLIEGDIRQTLDIVTPARKKFELNFWNFYSSFSSIGEKLEWRVQSGVPIALIARYNVSNPEDPQRSTSYLMVSRIGRGLSCVTDIVGPGPKQNEEARRLADEAPGKPCRASQ